MSTLHLGGHVDSTDPVAEAQARGARLSQFFLGDPQSYKGPVIAYAAGPAALKAAAEAAGIDLYVHAPYPINVASLNNRIRIPGRKLLQQHLLAAAEIGAKGSSCTAVTSGPTTTRSGASTTGASASTGSRCPCRC